ncbi:hypothetical protein HELRODRAFT_178129 [Helobdella robusta]|uniref:Uncharacterized protein n=1 Tax=Helobdella robusta TaxID=6412 RepID=T1FCS9_HELRO|nr:hypothetical protein HELRODRAFT_178129 [Helobdella robusta]ESN97343.1 hypothetical protein HELRODRAFT_178129 [Helobdella robusta]
MEHKNGQNCHGTFFCEFPLHLKHVTAKENRALAGYREDKPCEPGCKRWQQSCSDCKCKFTGNLTCSTGEHCGADYSKWYGLYITCYTKNQQNQFVPANKWDWDYSSGVDYYH